MGIDSSGYMTEIDRNGHLGYSDGHGFVLKVGGTTAPFMNPFLGLYIAQAKDTTLELQSKRKEDLYIGDVWTFAMLLRIDISTGTGPVDLCLISKDEFCIGLHYDGVHMEGRLKNGSTTTSGTSFAFSTNIWRIWYVTRSEDQGT